MIKKKEQKSTNCTKIHIHIFSKYFKQIRAFKYKHFSPKIGMNCFLDNERVVMFYVIYSPLFVLLHVSKV